MLATESLMDNHWQVLLEQPVLYAGSCFRCSLLDLLYVFLYILPPSSEPVPLAVDIRDIVDFI